MDAETNISIESNKVNGQTADEIVNNLDNYNLTVVNDRCSSLPKKICHMCRSKTIDNYEGILVCITCGLLVKESHQFKDDPTQQLTTNSHHFLANFRLTKGIRNNLPSAKVTNAKKMGRRTVENLVTTLNLSTDMKNEILMRWEETSMCRAFYNSSKQTKSILAAACVYITICKANSPITINHICNVIKCDSHEFGRVYNQVIQCFPEYKPPNVSIEDLVAVVLSEAKLDEAERNRLIERVLQLIKLGRELWLIEGRSPVHIIFAAAFLGWKSLDPCKRTKIKLTKFCTLLSIECKHTTSQRVTELSSALTTLAKRIPGKDSMKITKQNISLYIQEILDYQSSLMYDLKSHDDDQAELMNTFKRKTESTKANKSDDQAPEQSNNEEIDDRDIDCYIRSKSEVRLIKKLKRLVKDDDDDI